jgi:predicted nucleic acid-binding OB-fold protein
MKETKTIRNKWLTIRLSEEEEKRLHRLQEKTTSNSLSEYARKILLREPVTVKFRNQVADDFLSEMILLKFELNAIGKNFNQVVHKLHTLDTVAEIKAWIILNENSKKSFTRKIEEISDKINKVYMLWLQK